MVCHGDVNVENKSRRLTNISRLILGKVAVLNARHKWNQTQCAKETLFQKFFHFPFVLAACLTFRVLEEFFNILGKQILLRYEIQMFEMENCTRLASRLMHDRNYILFFHRPI